MDKRPWEIHPDLTEERLAFLARLIRSVRAEAVDAHDPTKGDTSWGLGCRSHERTLYSITNAAAGIASSWLRVIEPGLHFVFAAGTVPLRFYRGEAEKPPTKSLQRNYAELVQAQTSFSIPGFAAPTISDHKYIWRIAIETGFDGAVDRVVLVEVSEDGEAMRTTYEIPETAAGYVASTEPKRKEGKPLPSPNVGLKSTKKNNKKADDDET